MKILMKFLRKLSAIFKIVIKKLTNWLPDALIILGILSLAKGLYMIYKPSAFIATGLILMYIGWPGGGLPKKKVH